MFGSRKIINSRHAVWGATLGVHVFFVVLMAAVFVPTHQSVAVVKAPDASCWTKLECTQEVTQTDPSKRPNVTFVAGDGCSSGLGKCYAANKPIALAVSIGGKRTVLDIGDYIAAAYKYGVAIASIIAAIMMMIGGFQYLTAGGDASRVSAAKGRIVDAIVGLCLTLGAYLILNTINPDLVSLRLPRVSMVKRVSFVGCGATELCYACGSKYGIIMDPKNPKPVAQGDCKATTQDFTKEGIVATCIGRGCHAVNDACGDDANRCAKATGETDQPPSNCTPSTPLDPEKAANERYICQPCKNFGDSCTGTGKNAECCGGYCSHHTVGADTCTDGQAGANCDDNSECATGICQTNWGNRCSLGEIGAPCGADDSECRQDLGYICQTNGHNTCSKGKLFNWCADDSECGIDHIGACHVCNPSQSPDRNACVKSYKDCETVKLVCNYDWDNVCMWPRTGKVGKGCEANKDCSLETGGTDEYPLAGTLAFCQTSSRNFCTNGGAGGPCSDNTDCAAPPKQEAKDDNDIWHPSSDRPETGVCIEDIHTCSNGWLGAKCDGDGDCERNHCFKGGGFPVCVSGQLGADCDDNNDCENPPAPGAPLSCKDHRCLQ